ncbi:putative AraC family transcriptional regulator [Nostocoides japonicum T1-X7]|uniref:Putative AraC family transcriptional regulator n=1 Tax=Nostocoides japonicum T1-X7 TaxID=1194083 RepID=A0A077LZL0_9MICO|nr:helix-turn-helix transcriptional regulator [Tetrasphaera japonica]CCH78312.1 putative AraC family transcriptional regulator [Tetrasphaera japonica T1-X7]
MTGRHWHASHRPRGPLRRYACRVVAYGMSGEPPGRHIGMPSRRLTLVVSLDEPLTLTQPGDVRTSALGACVAGLAVRPTTIHHEGRWRGIQVDLRPSAARSLLGVPVAELGERSHELADVVGPVADTLRARLHDVGTPAEMFDVVDDALGALWGDTGGTRPEVAEAWRLLGTAERGLTVTEVARRVGWSTRHLESQLTAEVGLTPTQVVRLSRFERAHALVRDPGRRLADVAVAAGYADQAHLTREWKAFSGLTPTAWRAQELAYVQAVDGPADLSSGT